MAIPDGVDADLDVSQHLQIERVFAGEAVVVRAVGEVDLLTASLLRDHLGAAAEMATPPAPVVADLRDVAFFSSNGVTALLQAQQRCQQRRTPLHVLATRPVTRPLAVLGMGATFIVCPTLNEALDHCH